MDFGFSNYVLWWKSSFPLDEEYRRKYNIPYGSEQHMNTSQFDIIFDMCEGIVFDELRKKWKEEERKEKLAQNGVWLSESTTFVKEDNINLRHIMDHLKDLD